MKRLLLLLVTVVLFASCFNDAVQVNMQDAPVELVNDRDSISFAVGMIVSQDIGYDVDELGIDSTTVDDFLRGMYSAFPVDDSPEANAYAQGVALAAGYIEYLEIANEVIYEGDTTKSVNANMFFEGIKSSVYGSEMTMALKDAEDYYYKAIFRARSEEFIKGNIGRPGVISLSSGVQYKVERMGSGNIAAESDSVSIVAKGTYPNGSVFYTTRGAVVDEAVKDLVPGLAQVITTLPAGTKCMVYVPWNLAYGAEGNDRIPPYSALVYDLEIVDIVKD